MKIQVKVKIQPNASENKILNYIEDYLKIKITSSAIEGKANKTLIDFLSKKTGLPKSSLKIVKGEHTSKKILEIDNIEEDKLEIIKELLKLKTI